MSNISLEGTSAEAREVTLLELLDRIIDCGVVLTGNLTIAVADVDLITLGLNIVLASVERMEQLRADADAALAKYEGSA
ncbi:MAG TPA: gas vesicle protein [Ktedonobacterales bacterium]|nr:gas vesicle protein [Ktedonobacterales bacterium]